MPVQAFVLVDVWIFFSAGFAGLLLIRRHFNWSLVAFSGVFLLFLFNGHILAHYSVGHFTWGPYFLFPLVALLVFRFLDGDDSWRSVACVCRGDVRHGAGRRSASHDVGAAAARRC